MNVVFSAETMVLLALFWGVIRTGGLAQRSQRTQRGEGREKVNGEK
jgi:hypothetical protein